MKVSSVNDNIVLSDFNEADALRLAMKLERDGIKYYSELSSKTKDPEVKKAFRQFVKEEDRHLKKFGDWLNSLGIEADKGVEEGFFDFIDSGVFGDIWKTEESLKKIKTDLDALSLGEWAELNSINFYKALLDKTSSPSGKDILKEIVREEQEHLKAFIRYKDLLERSKKC
jgi:rubrerythrin